MATEINREQVVDFLSNLPVIQLAELIKTLEDIQSEFNKAQTGGKRVSLADLIVLGGCALLLAACGPKGKPEPCFDSFL